MRSDNSYFPFMVTKLVNDLVTKDKGTVEKLSFLLAVCSLQFASQWLVGHSILDYWMTSTRTNWKRRFW